MDAGSNDDGANISNGDGANISNGDGANVSNGNSSASADLQMAVYDVTGNKVFEGPVERITAGPYLTSWNGRNAGAQPCPPGVYFIDRKSTRLNSSHKCASR